MIQFTIERFSRLPRDTLFSLSTNIQNFDKILPNYFKSLKVIDQNGDQSVVVEEIRFMKVSLKLKTKHVVIMPDIHEIHILSGPAKGTTFTEKYVSLNSGTLVSIDVKLVLHGIFRFLLFFKPYIKNKMHFVADQFIVSAEKSVTN